MSGGPESSASLHWEEYFLIILQENSLRQQGIYIFEKKHLSNFNSQLTPKIGNMGRLGWAEIMRKEICQTLPH